MSPACCHISWQRFSVFFFLSFRTLEHLREREKKEIEEVLKSRNNQYAAMEGFDHGCIKRTVCQIGNMAAP